MVHFTGVRPPHRVMLSVMRALVIRDIQKRFILSAHTNRSFGFIWLFIEPLLHVVVWGGVRIFYDISSPGGLPMVLFILLGIFPFLMFRSVMSNSPRLIAVNRNVLIFRQIDVFDIALSWWLTEFLITLVVVALILTVMVWVGVPVVWFDPLRAMFFVFFFLLFMFGLSLIFMVLGFYFVRFNRLVIFLQRVLYFSSGIFFPASSIPPNLRNYFLINPLFQVIEGLRESFMFGGGLHRVTSLCYIAAVGIVTLALGLLVYVINRNRIMVSVEERL